MFVSILVLLQSTILLYLKILYSFIFSVQGLRNDFQEAMEKVDEAYLNEILALGTQVNKNFGFHKNSLYFS